MKAQKRLKCSALASLFVFSLLCMTISSLASHVSIGRYLSVAVKPQKIQQQLLQQSIQVKFPQNILTIKQAIIFLLQFSGYHLAPTQAMDQATRDMLNQALPEVDKIFGPMTLKQGLTTLVGHPFYLLIDPAHRLVAFQMKSLYQNLYDVPTTINSNPKREIIHYEYNKRM